MSRLNSLRTELLIHFALLTAAALIIGVASIVLLYGVLDPDHAAAYMSVIVAADVFYEQRPAQMFRAFLEKSHRAGITIFAGDPGRTYFPRDAFRQAAEYAVQTTTEIENHPIQTARVWTL